MPFLIILLFLFGMQSLGAVAESIPPSPLLTASCGITLLADDPSALLVSPFPENAGVQTGFTQLYGLSQLPRYSIAATTSRKRYRLGVGAVHLDHPLYTETQISAAISYDMGAVQPAVAMRVLRSAAQGYRRDSILLLDAGLQYQMPPVISRLWLSNITQKEIFDQSLPVQLNWELAAEVLPQAILGVSLEKEEGFDFSLRIGSRYQVLKPLLLVASYQYQPNRLGAGMEVTLGKIRVSYGLQSHSQLELTHCIGVGCAMH